MQHIYREDVYSVIYKGDLNRVKELVNSDNVNYYCPYNGTLLSFAITTRMRNESNYNNEIVEYLLSVGADPNVLTPMRSYTLLEYAKAIDDTVLYELLCTTNASCIIPYSNV